MDLLKALFRPEEAQLISSIPLGSASARDKVIWPHTQSGIYTVKSGYYFLSRDQDLLDGGASTPTPPKKLWKFIWSMSIPSKVRNFLWRAAKNAIPVKTSLVQRKVLTEETCDQCKMQPENVLHALWSCSCLDEVWMSDQVWSFRDTMTFSNFQHLIFHVIEANMDLEVFSMVVWSLWHRRNQVRVGKAVLPLGQTLARVQQQLQDYYRAQPMKSTPPQTIPHSNTWWTPPSGATLKVNYDGAVFHETNEAGLGAVIRNSAGRVLASSVERVTLPQTVAEVEAAAARRAILLAKELNLSSITLEGDSKIINRALQDAEQSFATFGNLIEEIKFHADSFLNCNFSYVKRKGNSVAHSLARHAKHVSGLFVWREEVPPPIVSVLLADYG